MSVDPNAHISLGTLNTEVFEQLGDLLTFGHRVRLDAQRPRRRLEDESVFDAVSNRAVSSLVRLGLKQDLSDGAMDPYFRRIHGLTNPAAIRAKGRVPRT